jgi:hypothetical protein
LPFPLSFRRLDEPSGFGGDVGLLSRYTIVAIFSIDVMKVKKQNYN